MALRAGSNIKVQGQTQSTYDTIKKANRIHFEFMLSFRVTLSQWFSSHCPQLYSNAH